MQNAAGTEDDDRVRNTGSPHFTDNSDNEMETSFSTFKPEPGMAAANPLYDSTCSLTGLPGCSSAKGISNPLYESSFSVKEEIGKVNYGANVDEDEGDHGEDLKVGGL